jgi:hypothetical protein
MTTKFFVPAVEGEEPLDEKDAERLLSPKDDWYSAVSTAVIFAIIVVLGVIGWIITLILN